MLRPTAKEVIAKEDYVLDIKFDNGERKLFDVKPYIQGEWYGKLKDSAYFKAVAVDSFTVVWPDVQDICPDELYENRTDDIDLPSDMLYEYGKVVG